MTVPSAIADTSDGSTYESDITPSPLAQSISSFMIPNLPPSAYYIPSFITPAEEATILKHINSAPLPTWKALSHRRLQAYPSVLSNSNTLLAAPLPDWLAEPIISRLLNLSLHHHHHHHYQQPSDENDATPPPPAHEHIFSNSPHGRPNHCLVNEYLPGQGIHPHEDGNAYWPVVATVSLGGHTVLHITPKEKQHSPIGDYDLGRKQPRQGWRILQEQRSLLISTGEVYTDCLHGIEAVSVDEGLHGGAGGVANWGLLGDPGVFGEGRKERGVRVSLTFRDVLRVKRLGKAFGGLGRCG